MVRDSNICERSRKSHNRTFVFTKQWKTDWDKKEKKKKKKTTDNVIILN